MNDEIERTANKYWLPRAKLKVPNCGGYVNINTSCQNQT